MSMTNPGTGASRTGTTSTAGSTGTAMGTTGAHDTRTEVRSRAADSFPRHEQPETKPSWKTSELWLTVAGIAAIIITYNVAEDASLDLWRTCLLIAIGGSAYVVSRGLAKAGSRDDKWTDADRRGREDYAAR